MKALGEFRIIKDHIHFRIIKRICPLTIHTECLHKENVWAATQKFVDSGGKAIWYVVTPINYEFVKAESGCRLSPAEYEKTLLQRYRWLKEHDQKIEVHVHLRIKMGLYDSEQETYNDSKKKITGATEWLRKHGFSPSNIVFGWWSFDEKSVKIAKENGLNVTNRMDYYFIHDYDLLGKL